MVRILAATLAVASAVSANNSEGGMITVVVDQLAKMKSESSKELEDGAIQFDEDQETDRLAVQSLERDIVDANDNIAENQACITSGDAKVSDLGADIVALTSSIQKAEFQLSTARKAREEQNKNFLVEEKELADAERMLTKALEILQRELGLVQLGQSTPRSMNKKLQAISQGLGAIINAAWVDAGGKRALQALMEVQKDSDEDDLSLTQQPQAAVSAYESHSGGIITALDDLRIKAVGQLASLRKAELSSKHNHLMLVQSLEDENKASDKTRADKKSRKAEHAASVGNCKVGLTVAQTDLKDSKASLVATQEKLASDATNWENTQKTLTEEIRTFGEAIDFLKQTSEVGGTAFIQKPIDETFDRREKVVSLMKHMGREYKSFGLMQLASAALSDPFSKVRGLISEMIAKLQKSQADEASREERCQADLAKYTSQLKISGQLVSKHLRRKEGEESKIAQAQAKIEKETQWLADSAKRQAARTTLRHNRSEENARIVKTQTEDVQLVQSAIQKLSAHFDKYETSRKQAGEQVITVMEQIVAEAEQVKAEAQTTETRQQADFDKFVVDEKVLTAQKKAEIEAAKNALHTATQMQATFESDWNSEKATREGLTKILATTKKECENKAMSFADRQAARKAEIEGLKEALKILNEDDGEDAALIQKKFLATRTSA